METLNQSEVKHMKKIVAGMVILSLLLSLCACRSSAYVGVYQGIYAEAEGQVYLMEDYFNGENYLELKKGGKADLWLNDSLHELKWKEDQGEIRFRESGDEFYGYISEGVIQMDYMGWGLSLTFAMDGAEIPETTVLDPEAQAEALAVADVFWNGDWYGWWEITDANGLYELEVGVKADLWARIDMTDGRGDLQIGQIGVDEPPIVECVLRVDPSYGDGGVGIAMSGRGSFMGREIQSGDWLIDPDQSAFEDYLEISGYYTDENGDFFYVLHLRPWGRTWEDVQEAAGTDAVPNGLPSTYQDYILALEAGLDMDTFLQDHEPASE